MIADMTAETAQESMRKRLRPEIDHSHDIIIFQIEILKFRRVSRGDCIRSFEQLAVQIPLFNVFVVFQIPAAIKNTVTLQDLISVGTDRVVVFRFDDAETKLLHNLIIPCGNDNFKIKYIST